MCTVRHGVERCGTVPSLVGCRLSPCARCGTWQGVAYVSRSLAYPPPCVCVSRHRQAPPRRHHCAVARLARPKRGHNYRPHLGDYVSGPTQCPFPGCCTAASICSQVVITLRGSRCFTALLPRLLNRVATSPAPLIPLHHSAPPLLSLSHSLSFSSTRSPTPLATASTQFQTPAGNGVHLIRFAHYPLSFAPLRSDTLRTRYARLAG